jgi:hypothetical protein
VTLLTAKTLDLGDGQAGDAHLGQCFANLFELEGLDDGGDLLHDGAPEYVFEINLTDLAGLSTMV